MNLLTGPRPDITPSQVVAGIVAGIPILASLLRAFGVYDLSVEQQQALNDTVTWASVFAGALIGGDAIVRTGRNLRKGAVEAALVAAPDIDPTRVQVMDSVITPAEPEQPASDVSTPPPVKPATKLPST